jgi:Cu+-exporting ATPase
MQIDPVGGMQVDEANTQKVILPVQGMSCASCGSRVQKALNQVPGVIHATVNFATEKAAVDYIPSQIGVEDLAAAIASAGYRVPEIDEKQVVDQEKATREAEFKLLKR